MSVVIFDQTWTVVEIRDVVPEEGSVFAYRILSLGEDVKLGDRFNHNTGGWESDRDRRPLNQRTYEIFKHLPLDVQVMFSAVWVQVETAIRNRNVPLAKRLVELTPVPAELEPLKQAILAEFNK